MSRVIDLGAARAKRRARNDSGDGKCVIVNTVTGARYEIDPEREQVRIFDDGRSIAIEARTDETDRQ